MKPIEYECENCIYHKTQCCRNCGYWADSKERMPTRFKPKKEWLKSLLIDLTGEFLRMR